MPYRILWAPYAEDKLERLLKTASDADALADAARGIDRLLVVAPKGFGESRYELIRVGFVFPLGVQYEVMDDVETVIVHDVWRIDHM